jgi:hypothetical protein
MKRKTGYLGGLKNMGCLKLTYLEEPTLFLGARPEKKDTPVWRVWVKSESDFLGVDEVVQTQDCPSCGFADFLRNTQSFGNVPVLS